MQFRESIRDVGLLGFGVQSAEIVGCAWYFPSVEDVRTSSGGSGGNVIGKA